MRDKAKNRIKKDLDRQIRVSREAWSGPCFVCWFHSLFLDTGPQVSAVLQNLGFGAVVRVLHVNGR